jgi:hypothetical protein
MSTPADQPNRRRTQMPTMENVKHLPQNGGRAFALLGHSLSFKAEPEDTDDGLFLFEHRMPGAVQGAGVRSLLQLLGDVRAVRGVSGLAADVSVLGASGGVHRVGPPVTYPLPVPLVLADRALAVPLLSHRPASGAFAAAGPPVPVAEDAHGGRNEQDADDRRVYENGHGEAQANRFGNYDAAKGKRTGHDDDNGRG